MPVHVITTSQALLVAKRWFQEGRDLVMDELADELAVGRATLYRLVGSRNRLLGEVLAELGQETLHYALARATELGFPAGADRVLAAGRVMNRAIVRYRPLRRFVERDPDTAFRVLFAPNTRVHVRQVEGWARVLAAADEAGELSLTIDPGRLAYLFVRIGESVIFADLIADRSPDLEVAESIQRSLVTQHTMTTRSPSPV